MSDERIAIIGNAGAGKSTLARKIAANRNLSYIEIDRLLWLPGWELVPEADYKAAHAQVITGESWIIDGLGRQDSIEPRLRRATSIILIDMPLWMHFWLTAERQISWHRGRLDHPPAGGNAPPPMDALFRTIWDVDKDWMPGIRDLVQSEQKQGKRVDRISSVDELNHYASSF